MRALLVYQFMTANYPHLPVDSVDNITNLANRLYTFDIVRLTGLVLVSHISTGPTTNTANFLIL